MTTTTVKLAGSAERKLQNAAYLIWSKQLRIEFQRRKQEGKKPHAAAKYTEKTRALARLQFAAWVYLVLVWLMWLFIKQQLEAIQSTRSSHSAEKINFPLLKSLHRIFSLLFKVTSISEIIQWALSDKNVRRRRWHIHRLKSYSNTEMHEMLRLSGRQLTTDYNLVKRTISRAMPLLPTSSLPILSQFQQSKFKIMSYSQRGTWYPGRCIFAKGDESLSQCKQSRLMLKI